MPAEEHYRKLEQMYLHAPINQLFRPQIQISEGRAEVSLPLRSDFWHAAGAVHGAVYFKMLDDAAFFAANSLVTDVFVLTVSFNVYFTRPVSAGELRSRGWVTHQSRRLLLAEAELLDDQGRQVARGSGAFMRSDTPLDSVPGYGNDRPVGPAVG